MLETLEDLGLTLRTEREKRFLSVEDVADGLKISARVLRAIEAGDSSSLPHAVYVRGFVSAYGKFLELDVQELLATPALYDDDEAPKAAPLPAATVKKSASKINIPLILFLCFVLAGGLGVWFYRDAVLFSSLQEEHLNTAQPAPALPQGEKQAKNALSSSQASTAKPDANTASGAASAVAGAHSADTKNQEDQGPKAEPAAPKQALEQSQNSAQNTRAENAPKEQRDAEAQSATAYSAAGQKAITQDPVIAKPRAAQTPPSNPLQGPHKIIITALVNTWIHSSADGGGMRQFSLKPGDTFALTFDDSLKLTLGNAGGVRIHYNGKELSVLGQNGEEKTVTFPLKM